MDQFVVRTPKPFKNLDNDPEKRNSQCSENQIFQDLPKQTLEKTVSATPELDHELSSDLGRYFTTAIN